MKRFLLSAVVALGVVAILTQASWAKDRRGRAATATHEWAPAYYDAAYGMPVAVVVPPTAEYQTHWNWGVGGTQITPIREQFSRNWPGPIHYDPRTIRPTPAWPSSTDQFGDYYVRGPW